ncbi:MAG TPA: hypothetical protein EYH05_13540 [Anaerolineae bacterium]|nr:hypothetical protein [Anaerolineae bacterium]
MHLLKRLGLVFITAYILMFFSEFFFVNEGVAFDVVRAIQTQPASLLGTLAKLLLFYGLPAYIFLTAVSLFRGRTVWAIFLAGALYGWIVEGVVVWQMYEALPFTISWTPLGWHVIIDVLLGWYLARWLLLKDRYGVTAVLAIALGAFWGLWATWYWQDGRLIPPAEFALFALFTGGLWVLANGLLTPFIGHPFQPSKIEIGLLLTATAGLFALNILTILPVAILVLPPLFIVTLFALKRNRKTEERADVIVALAGQPRRGQYALLGLTPLAAVVVYTAVYQWPLRLPLTDLIALPLMLAGFVLFLISFIQIFRRKRTQPTNLTHTPSAGPDAAPVR